MQTRKFLQMAVFLAAAFVVAPLIVVALRGGSNLKTRYQQWGAMRVSLQSEDPGRLAVDDPARDIAIIESFISPGPDRRSIAERYHREWVAGRDWWTIDGELLGIDYEANGDIAVVRSRITTKHVDNEHKREYERAERWRKVDGIWYIVESNDELLEAYHDPIKQPVLP